jgi:hypothetical protein
MIARTDGAGEHEQVRGVTLLGGRHVAALIRAFLINKFLYRVFSCSSVRVGADP